MLERMRAGDGAPLVCDRVWISSIGSADEERVGRLTAGYGAAGRGPKIGPEFTFGITMQNNMEEPILIIKTAWGGRSLHTDFRPPGAGPFEFTDAQLDRFERDGADVESIKSDKLETTGRSYRLMIGHVRSVLSNIQRVYPDYDPDQGHEIAGFVWFQGWNDMVDRDVYPRRDKPGGYDAYSELLGQFIRDVRTDLAAPSMPVVIGVLGVGGPLDAYAPNREREKVIHDNFRTAMAAPAGEPEFRGTVVAVPTAPCWDMQVVALREREGGLAEAKDEIERRTKAGMLSDEEGEDAIDLLYTSTFSPRELVILRESTSNADYHYMGSAGIMALIGQAFAEALINMNAGASAAPGSTGS